MRKAVYKTRTGKKQVREFGNGKTSNSLPTVNVVSSPLDKIAPQYSHQNETARAIGIHEKNKNKKISRPLKALRYDDNTDTCSSIQTAPEYKEPRTKL